MRRLPSLRLRRSRLSAPVPPPPPPPDFQGLESNWRPAGRVFIAAAGLALVVALAITLTLALPESDANAGDATPPNQQADAPQQSGGNNGNDGNNPGNGDPEDEGDGEDGADPPRPPQGGAQAAEATGQAQAQSTVTLTVGKIAETTATLTIDGHTTAWYYKADVAPDNTCKGPVTAGAKTKNLTGLSGNTTYTYTAYSDSTCTTANQLAAASPFTTGPWLNVIDVNDTTAKLFLSSLGSHRKLVLPGQRRAGQYLPGAGGSVHHPCPDRTHRQHCLHLHRLQRQRLHYPTGRGQPVHHVCFPHR